MIHSTLDDENRQFDIHSMFSKKFAKHIDECITLDYTIDLFKWGDTNQDEIIKLLCFLSKGKNFFEFGTFQGRTTANVSKYANHVITLDINNTHNSLKDNYEYGNYELGKFYKLAKRPNVTQLIGDSTSIDLTPYYNFADIVYVDGDHSLEGCTADINSAYKIGRNRGWVIIDGDGPEVEQSIVYNINMGNSFARIGQLFFTRLQK